MKKSVQFAMKFAALSKLSENLGPRVDSFKEQLDEVIDAAQTGAGNVAASEGVVAKLQAMARDYELVSNEIRDVFKEVGEGKTLIDEFVEEVKS